MSDNENDTPNSMARTPRSTEHGVPGGEDVESTDRDHELFNQHADATESEVGAPESGPISPPEDAAPTREHRGYWQKFTVLIAIAGLLITGGGVGAIMFKDRDARLRAISEAIDDATKDPESFASNLEARLSAWWASRSPTAETPPDSQTAMREAPPSPGAPEHAAEPETRPESESAHRTPQPGWASRDRKNTSDAAPAPSLAAPAPSLASPAPLAARSEKESEGEFKALAARVEQLEATAREALEAVKEARPTAKPPEAGDKAGTPAADESYMTALEGRIDELAEEVRKVREQLTQTKSETRVAPDAAEPAASSQVKAITAAETLVLAQSVREALELGRPFSAELAALIERGADPGLVAALTPVAEKGAPTAAQLLASFPPMAKRLRSLEDAGATGGSLTDQLLHGAGKLVRVRPVDEPTRTSISEHATRIGTELARGDVGAASDAFAKLPENAQAEAKDFGEALKQRREAERAASALLTGAIAGLGHARN